MIAQAELLQHLLHPEAHWANSWKLMKQAAWEIERLNKQNQQLQRELDSWRWPFWPKR